MVDEDDVAPPPDTSAEALARKRADRRKNVTRGVRRA